MTKSAVRSAGAALALVALLGGAVACQGGDDDKAGKSGRDSSPSRAAAPQRTPAQVITAAYKKTDEAKSAKVTMTVSLPADIDGGGDMRMSGVMGWDPLVMDITMSGSMLASEPDAPEKVRTLMADDVIYMDLGKTAAKDMDGKRWLKLDLEAAAKASGDEKAVQQMTGGLEEMNQDPSQQLALMLDSPNLKDVGREEIDGEQTDHYKGTLTVEEMTKTDKSLDVLGEKERKDLIDSLEESGVQGYDTEVWVNEDDYPVKMLMDIDSPEGAMKITARYSDYGAEAKVEAPLAADTFDLCKMLKELREEESGTTA